MDEEFFGMTGILGGYEVHLFEDPQRAQGDILKVTDRRSNYIERPGHIPPCPEGRKRFAANIIKVLLSAYCFLLLELIAKSLELRA
jgi:hypothetical protein